LSLGTDPSKPNPNVSYALSNKIPVELAKNLAILDKDGRMDINERSLIDLLSTLPPKTHRSLIQFRLDETTINFLLTISSLQDQNFAKYAIENRLCIQDRKFTDLEKNFLQEPEKYKKELFDVYMAEGLKVYPELFEEFKKLPDFKEVDVKDVEAIEDLVYLAGLGYKDVFELMLNIGIKDKRKYCTPLQVLSWVVYDEEPEKLEDILKNYTLEKLIEYGWRQSSTSNNYKSERWENFDEVVDRLNSPKLVSLWLGDNTVWSMNDISFTKSAKEFFLSKEGACMRHALFATYCLINWGYDAKGLDVVGYRTFPGTWVTGHTVCFYKNPTDGFYYTIDSRPRG